VRRLPFRDDRWCYSRRLRVDDPFEGWKLHVSATPLTANRIYSLVRPHLAARKVLFKVPRRLEFLAQLNTGLRGFPQIGKFLTVYPKSAEEATELAHLLHEATRGLNAPAVPFDAPYRKRSIVYYRYGSFRVPPKESGMITDARGRKRLDRRAPNSAVPYWLADPFHQNAVRPVGIRLGPLAPDYLVYKIISQRGKGGVYEALDLSAATPRAVIIKEGRAHGETDWQGADGRAFVKHEGHVLRCLRAAGLPVPKIFRQFDRGGHHYLVLQKLDGPPLQLPTRKTRQGGSWRDATKILRQLEPLLEKIHAAGWVWRDCKPSHVFRRQGRGLGLLDFEGACRVDEEDVLPWGSENYSPGPSRNRFRRRSGFAEDDYALGVIAFQFGTGRFPQRTRSGRLALYQQTKCPPALQAKLESWLFPRFQFVGGSARLLRPCPGSLRRSNGAKFTA